MGCTKLQFGDMEEIIVSYVYRSSKQLLTVMSNTCETNTSH